MKIGNVFSKKVLSSAVASVIATTLAVSAHSAGNEVIDTVLFGHQDFTADTTSITVTGTGGVNNASDNDDGIHLDGAGHNISKIEVQQPIDPRTGGFVVAGFDAIYTGDSAKTIGSITVAGNLWTTINAQGSGISIDSDLDSGEGTVVNGDVTITSTGSYLNTGSVCNVAGADCDAPQSGISLNGTVNGNLINHGSISARNGITILGGIIESTGSTFGGTLNGSVLNSGSMTVNGEAGIYVLSGGHVTGDLENSGTITATGSGAVGIHITGQGINFEGTGDNGTPNGRIVGTEQTVVEGNVINSGTITAEFDGIGLYDNVLVGGDIINTGTIDVSHAENGDAAAIFLGDDDEIAAALPTVTGSIINAGTLISDDSLDDEGIATAVLDGSFTAFTNQAGGVIRNLNPTGLAIDSGSAAHVINNSGLIDGGVFLNSGTFNSTGGISGSIAGAGRINILQSAAAEQTITTVNGDLTFGGALGISAQGIQVAQAGKNTADLTDTLTGSRLNVTGDANLTGASVNIDVKGAGFIDNGDEFVFVDAQALTSDITLASDNSAILSFDVEQRGNTLVAIAEQGDVVEIIAQANGEVAENLSQVGMAFNTLQESFADLAPSSDLAAVVTEIQQLPEEQLVAALESLQPETNNSSAVGSISADNAAAGSVNERVANLRAAKMSGLAAGDGTSAINGFWVQGYSNNTEQDNIDSIDGFEADTTGLALGIDFPLDQNVNLGVAFSYADTDVDSNGAENNTMQIDSYRLAGYGSYNADSYFVDAQISYAQNRYDANRNLFNGTVATSDHDGDQYSARLRLGAPMAMDSGLRLTPIASIEYTYLKEESYRESGTAGNAGLYISNDDAQALLLGLGGEMSYSFIQGNYRITPEFHLMAQHDFIGDEVETNANFLGAASAAFTTKGADVEQSAINSGLGLRIQNGNHFSLALRYDYLYKEDYNSQSYSAVMRYAF